MSTPLKTQIRDYFAYVDDRQGAVDISLLPERLEVEEGDLVLVDIQTRETDTHQQEDETGRRWPFYVVVAAAAVIVVIVAIALFGGTEEGAEIDVVDSPADIGPESDEQLGGSTPEEAAGKGAMALYAGDTQRVLDYVLPGIVEQMDRDAFSSCVLEYLGLMLSSDWEMGDLSVAEHTEFEDSAYVDVTAEYVWVGEPQTIADSTELPRKLRLQEFEGRWFIVGGIPPAGTEWWCVERDSATRAGAAFSWDADDLSEWVTGDELTGAVADLSMRFEGLNLVGKVRLDERADNADEDWEWTYRLVGDTESWRVYAHDGDHGGKYEGPPTETDPRLPEGATYEAAWGFAHGFYVVSGPASDESICIALFPPGTSFGYPTETEVEVHEDRLFALASVMLQEMGWADSGGGF